MEAQALKSNPIVRVTSWSVSAGNTGGGKEREESGRWAIYGVDADGNERLYAEHATREEFEAWRTTDPLWREAERAMFDRLLSNPVTRDVVLKINIKAALDKGDDETAMALIRHLSPEAWRRLIE